ncbi:MAG: SurA N-terminal domain-containing protein [Bacteroidales bacterium]|nr:SurA N-terminal domain-containing protein [Bacteroidales bacterium]
MATLQKIRSKGPLLVIVIGLALFAFIAGDAWKVLKPNQGRQDIGEINGQKISALDYQNAFEELSEIVKAMQGVNALNDQQTTYVKDQVWQNMVFTSIISAEAEKLGLVVTDAEIQAVTDEGTNPMLMQTPFRNPETGKFDKDMLKKFLAEYAMMNNTQMPQQYREYYQQLVKIWEYTERSLKENLLAQKYQALVQKSFLTNNIAAEMSFAERTSEAEALVASYPYMSLRDTSIVASSADLQALYSQRKEEFKQPVETRNIKYVDFQVVPSEQDRADLLQEMTEYAEQLGSVEEVAAFVRSANSTVPYSDIAINKESLPADVATRLDSVQGSEVYGPYFNATDDSYNVIRLFATEQLPDSVQFTQLALTPEAVDSVYAALEAGADFAETAKNYGQSQEAVWLAASQYEGSQLDADNLTFIRTLLSATPNTLNRIKIGDNNIIYKVLAKTTPKTKYNVAVIKRPAEFSKETYNNEYNRFSQFVAQNKTLKDLVDNTEEANYRLLERADISTSEHYVGGVQNTRDALKWIFEAKEGEVSPLYECGENNHLMVIGLEKVNKAGYRDINAVADELGREVINNKKAEKIIAMWAGKSIADVQGTEGVVVDTIKHITFSAPVFVSATVGSEPVLAAVASKAEVGAVSAPLKGTAGVYLMQVLKKDKTAETFDATKEKASCTARMSQYAAAYMQELVSRAKIIDNRYLYF